MVEAEANLMVEAEAQSLAGYTHHQLESESGKGLGFPSLDQREYLATIQLTVSESLDPPGKGQAGSQGDR